MNLRIVLCGCLLFSSVASAATTVYKCEENGKITYTDRPCGAQAREEVLPPLIVAAPPSRRERDLARAHDARLATEQAERDRADGTWLKEHGRRKDREARVHRAILSHSVIRSMTFDEVRQALGEPDRVDRGDSYGTAKETWTYESSGATRTVNFKDGEVTSTHSKGRRRK